MTHAHKCRTCTGRHFMPQCPGCWVLRSFGRANTPAQKAAYRRRVFAYLTEQVRLRRTQPK